MGQTFSLFEVCAIDIPIDAKVNVVPFFSIPYPVFRNILPAGGFFKATTNGYGVAMILNKVTESLGSFSGCIPKSFQLRSSVSHSLPEMSYSNTSAE